MLKSGKKKRKKKIIVSLVSGSSDEEEDEKKKEKKEHQAGPGPVTKQLIRDEGSMTVEEYSTKILQEVGPHHWIRHLMKEIESAGPMSKHTNVAIEIVRNFPVIVFSSSGNRIGKKVIKLLDEVRRKHDIHESSVLEVYLDDTRSGNKTYNDLVLVTKQLGLPQVFIDEVFYGGYDEIKSLHHGKKLGRTMLAAVGFTNLPCKICKKKGLNFHNHQYWK